MQSRTQRASPVPCLNWNRLLGKTLGAHELAIALQDDVAIVHAVSCDFLAIKERVILVAKVSGFICDGNLLGEART